MTTETDTIAAPNDIFGNTIQPGDTVVYATRRGSDTFLRPLVVTAVNYAIKPSIQGYNPNDITRRKRTISNLNCVAVTHAAV